MNSWNQFLASLGARPGPDTVRDFGRTLSPTDLASGFAAVASELGLIAVNGDDAGSFLHNQLTNDVLHLDTASVRLAAYCSPKGRMLASMFLWREQDSIMLQLPKSLAPAIQKRLSMFVLRAKAKLTAVDDRVSIAVGGAKGAETLGRLAGVLPAAPWQAHKAILRLPDAFGAPRFLWVMTHEQAQQHLPALRDSLALGGNDAWQLSQIHAGIATIEAKTQEQFVPQMVNYELLGGVNFKKGCYPGQEIVARSQYLGKLKRRAFLAQVAAECAAGDEVFAESDPGQPCGMVVNAAPNGTGGTDLLVELKLDAADAGAIHLMSAAGPALQMLPMPYALDALDV